MMQKERDELKSESSSLNDNDEDLDSDVEYPIINLKGPLSNDLAERRRKDIEKFTNKSQRKSHFKSTEFSREVIGHNKMSQFQMTKAVNYFFSEFDYLREKMKREQQKTMKKLQEIHCDKRKQIRESYKYHNEELRYDLQRMKDEQKFLAEQAELEDMMRRRENSIARIALERKILMKEINSKDKEKLKNTEKSEMDVTVKKIPKATEEFDQSTSHMSQSRSHSFLRAGAVEVTKDNMNPRTTKRASEYLVEDIKPIPIPLVCDSNILNVIPSHDALPEIENKISVSLLNIDEVNENNISKPIIPSIKRKTIKEIMYDRNKLKEKRLKEILNLPYNIYRRNSKGKLQKVDHIMPKNEFKEPSNKEKYNMRKAIGEEREKMQNYISDLTKTTEEIIEEDIKISRNLNAPAVNVVKEPVAESRRTAGPQDWINAFVSSNIPDDVDPTSTEAIIFCRYIRAPLHKYSHLPNYKLYHTPL